MDYIATVDPSQPSGFDCMHGQSECVGDITELCVQMLTKNNWQQWFQLVQCADQNYGNIPTNLDTCAQQLGLDVNQIHACAKGSIGKALMMASINRTNSLPNQPIGSPTIYINGACDYGFYPCNNLSGPQWLDAVCAAYTGPLPPACSQAKPVVSGQSSSQTDLKICSPKKQ